MLSVANVRTAAGAANYFAADNYYTRADADRSGAWFGKGAERLGLSGEVDPRLFEAVLKGFLPDGNRVGSDGRSHRAGTDLTFSLPKSWSLIALVGGDQRVLDAYAGAVRETLSWAERNLAETRIETNGREQVQRTGNLIAALFQHDTNRNQEPNAHIHAVVANVTQDAGGKWRALRNDKLWEHNTLLNAMTMARFRLSVERLGYEVGAVGKHGNFEAAGVPRSVIEAFSTRRAEILAKLDTMDHQGPAASDAATLMTRAAKAAVVDRGALQNDWSRTAKAIGFDPASLIAKANSRAATQLGAGQGLRSFAVRLASEARAVTARLAERLGLRQGDPLIPADLAKRSPEDAAAVQAVAAAVRHLSEREAAFPRTAIYKAALDFGFPAALPAIERRVTQLERRGELLRGTGAERGLVTTAAALRTEQRIIAAVEEGRGKVAPMVASDVVGDRLQALSQLQYGMTLNAGQEGAGRLLLSSHNRIVAVQGIAGAGKSTVLRPVADILREEGRKVLGLAVQNTLVQMLTRDTGIPAMTVARFLRRHAALLEGGDAGALREARKEWRGAVILLDEASMVGNTDQDKLLRLANLLELGRFASIGDKQQLGAVDAGKPFAVIQAAGAETATMDINIRARSKSLRAAQTAAQRGDVGAAISALGPAVVEVGNDAAVSAAAAWLGLAPQERETTAIYASGRALRGEVNAAVQSGLKANGEIGAPSLRLDVLVRVNTTREELRHAATFQPRQVLEVEHRKRAQGLDRGSYRVIASDPARGKVTLENARGRQFEFRPGKLRPQGEHEPLRLFETAKIELHAGDKIRWTDTDHKRGLLNADQARIDVIGERSVSLTTSGGIAHELARSDPMLRRLDLAYALNAHMAQGLTSDRGIAVMDSRERNLSNQQTFLVTVTRLRDGLTLFVNNTGRLEQAIGRNDGAKRSALETVGLLREAAASGLAKGRPADPAISKPAEPIAPERDRTIVKPFEIGL